MVVAMHRPLPVIVLLLMGSLVLIPSAGAQGVCDDGPGLPTCIEPDVEVELPEHIDARWKTGIWQGPQTNLTALVNITFNSESAPPEEESVLTVETAPIRGLAATTGSTAITPGDTVTLPIDLTLTTQIPAGTNSLSFYVNTTGTNVHASTSQVVESELLMVWWWQHQGMGDVDLRRADAGLEVLLAVRAFESNGPVDFLVIVEDETHTPNPSIIRTSETLEPGVPVTSHWNLTFEGEDSRVRFQLWAITEEGDGLSCFHDETFEPVAIEDNQPDEDCFFTATYGLALPSTGQIGGLSGLVFLVSNGLVLLGMIGAVLLGGFVLRRGGKKLPARSLGIYLIMAGVGFGLMSFHWILVELFGWVIANRIVPPFFWPIVGTAFIILPTAILFFAIGYPTRHPRLKNMKHWYLLPFAPWILFTPFIFIKNEDAAFIMSFTFIILGTIVAAILFRQRAAQAATQLERERLLFMYRFVSFPLIAGAALVMLGASLDLYVLDGAIWQTGLPGILIAPVALGPVLGLSWGLLRYKIVDLDTKLRLTINRGFIGAVFIAVFFLATETAKLVFSAAIGPVVGLLAAALLVAAIAPLERVGRRLATRVVPEPPDPQAYQSFRRLEIYRAAYEEVAVDDEITNKERRAMDSLARSLNLSPKEVEFVESEVMKEREVLTQNKGDLAVSAT